MKILYLTTAIEDGDYNSLLNKGYRLSNPSNQNFHDKMIKALALGNEVSVISLVPSLENDYTLTDKGIYRYVNYHGALFNRLGGRKRKMLKIAKAIQRKGLDIVLFDSLNLQIGEAALALGKQFSLPVVSLVTDNPENLAKTPRIFVSNVKFHVNSSTGVLALSDGLLKAFNVESKPHFVFPGLVEKPTLLKPLFAPKSYFYFGGALLERYGIIDLIKAYLATNPDYDLVLAGHAGESETFNRLIHSSPRIHFLGQVSKEENYTLEAYAALLINPRPFESKLDQESVPSKLLEYLESGTPIVSTPHTALKKEFPNDIAWLEGSGEKVLTTFFQSHLNPDKKLINLVENHAAERLYATYGVEALGKKIQDFLHFLKA